MRITFILPTISLSGGVKVIFQYANCLTARGHQVRVVYPLIPLRWGAPWHDVSATYHQSMQVLGNIRKGEHISWFDLKAPLLRAKTLAAHHIPDADIVVATAWCTAPIVHGYPASKGEKCYLIQHYEAVMGPQSLVDETWRLPIHKIVIASWLKELGEERFGQQVFGPIINGVNQQHYYGEPRTPTNAKRIGMMWHTAEFKGIPDGLQAVEQARTVFPDLALVLFGSHHSPGIPDCAEFHLAPPVKKIREIYTSCDIFLSPSWSEGCQLPPMEAMACGCAVVATNVGGIPDYTINGETVIAVPPKRPDLLSEALLGILRDDEKRQRLARAGHRHIQKYTWDRATNLLENTFDIILRDHPSIVVS